jgi:hypothetical protein
MHPTLKTALLGSHSQTPDRALSPLRLIRQTYTWP